MSKRKKIIIWTVLALLVIGIGYTTAVFSNIPFIKKWRTIYIETAMTTFTHQWLATAFIPEHIINDVMDNAYENQAIQDGLSSKWDGEKIEITVDMDWRNDKNKKEVLYTYFFSFHS